MNRIALEKICLFPRLLKFVVVRVMGIKTGAKQAFYHSASSPAL